jgi:hypothetical protein
MYSSFDFGLIDRLDDARFVAHGQISNGIDANGRSVGSGLGRYFAQATWRRSAYGTEPFPGRKHDHLSPADGADGYPGLPVAPESQGGICPGSKSWSARPMVTALAWRCYRRSGGLRW